jgi:hypothetical protein
LPRQRSLFSRLHDHLDQTWTSIFHSACELPREFFNPHLHGGRAVLAKIFISYRRGDDPGSAGRLFDALKDALEADQLFTLLFQRQSAPLINFGVQEEQMLFFLGGIAAIAGITAMVYGVFLVYRGYSTKERLACIFSVF